MESRKQAAKRPSPPLPKPASDSCSRISSRSSLSRLAASWDSSRRSVLPCGASVARGCHERSAPAPRSARETRRPGGPRHCQKSDAAHTEHWPNPRTERGRSRIAPEVVPPTCGLDHCRPGGSRRPASAALSRRMLQIVQIWANVPSFEWVWNSVSVLDCPYCRLSSCFYKRSWLPQVG